MAEIRPATLSDAALLAGLEARATTHPWSQKQYQDSLAQHHCHVLTLAGDIIGSLIFSRVLDEVELLNIVIAPEFQGRGYGRQLLGHLLALNRGLAAAIFLEVRRSNAPAIALYQRQGFALAGTRKNYYPSADFPDKNAREDALIMVYHYE